MGKALFISVLLLILTTCSGVVLAYPTYWWGGFSGARYSDENGNPIYTTEQYKVTFWVEVSPPLRDAPHMDFKWYDPHGKQVPPTTKGGVTIQYFYVAGFFFEAAGYFYISEEERELGLYRVECYANYRLLFTDYFQICTNPSFQVNVNGAIFNVTILSNSTITSFNFSKTEKKITFNVTGPDGRLGFCNVTIPNALFDAPPEEWKVLVDNKEVDTKMTPINATHTSLYFKYIHTTHKVTIMEPDTTPPVTVNDYVDAWQVADFTITLTTTDYESGVAETYYRINDGPIQSVSTHGQPRITTESANNTLEYWSLDKAGNEELPHKVLTGIKLDKTAPTGSIAINNDAVYATSTSVTLTLTAVDVTSGVYKVRFSNDGVWDTEPWEIPSPTKTWTLTLGDGTKTVYYQIRDNAGLVSITYSDTIVLDITPPTGSVTIAKGAIYTNSTSVTLTLSAEDATSGIAQMRFSNDNATWTPWEAYSTSKAWVLITGDGTKTVYVQFKDNAGLISQSFFDVIILDTARPATTISLSGVLGNNGWFTSDVTVILSAADDISGVNKTEYSLDDATWTAYATPFTVSVEGNTIVYYRSTDKAGNAETIKTKMIKIDKTVPSGSININNGDAYTTSTLVVLALTATDATSGIYQVRYSNDGVWDTEPWETPSPTKTWTLTSGNGTKIIYYQIKDNAGLTSEIYSDTIILDTIPPSGFISINEGATYTTATTVTLTLSAIDVTSGVAEMRFSNDNITWTPWEAYSTSKMWALITGDGTKTVYVQYRDNAGLVSPTYKATIILDTTKPVANAGQDKKVNVGETVTFDAGASTDNVAIVSYEWEFGDGTKGTGKTTTHVYAKPGTYMVTLTVKDAAGNAATHSLTVTVVEAFPTWMAGVVIAAIAVIIGVVFAMRKRKPKA